MIVNYSSSSSSEEETESSSKDDSSPLRKRGKLDTETRFVNLWMVDLLKGKLANQPSWYLACLFLTPWRRCSENLKNSGAIKVKSMKGDSGPSSMSGETGLHTCSVLMILRRPFWSYSMRWWRLHLLTASLWPCLKSFTSVSQKLWFCGITGSNHLSSPFGPVWHSSRSQCYLIKTSLGFFTLCLLWVIVILNTVYNPRKRNVSHK